MSKIKTGYILLAPSTHGYAFEYSTRTRCWRICIKSCQINGLGYRISLSLYQYYLGSPGQATAPPMLVDTSDSYTNVGQKGLAQCTPLLVEKAGVTPDVTFRFTTYKQDIYSGFETDEQDT